MMRSLIRKTIALAVIGAGLALSVAPAEAQWRRWHRGPRGGAVAAAAIGGLAAGALIAGAARPAYGASYYAAPSYAPAYAPAYTPAPVYYSQPAYQPAYATPTYYHAPRRHHRPVYRRYASYEPICTIRRTRVWLGPNTYTFRRQTVCR